MRREGNTVFRYRGRLHRIGQATSEKLKMEAMSTWEMVLIGALVVLVLFWIGPGIKPMLEQSRQAEKDWAGLLIPIIAVILFVILLVMMV
jgi:ABC-type methionine transport system permease subunit